MPINGPRPRPGGPGEVNLGMYHDPPRRSESVGYAGGGGGGEIPDFNTFWNETGRKMFGTPPINMARGGPVPKRPKISDNRPVPSDNRTVSANDPKSFPVNSDDRTVSANDPKNFPVSSNTGYARGGPVRYDQYGAPIREEDDVNPSTAPDWSSNQRKMAMYELGSAQGYAQGGSVEDEFYDPVAEEDIQRRKYALQQEMLTQKQAELERQPEIQRRKAEAEDRDYLRAGGGQSLADATATRIRTEQGAAERPTSGMPTGYRDQAAAPAPSTLGAVMDYIHNMFSVGGAQAAEAPPQPATGYAGTGAGGYGGELVSPPPAVRGGSPEEVTAKPLGAPLSLQSPAPPSISGQDTPRTVGVPGSSYLGQTLAEQEARRKAEGPISERGVLDLVTSLPRAGIEHLQRRIGERELYGGTSFGARDVWNPEGNQPVWTGIRKGLEGLVGGDHPKTPAETLKTLDTIAQNPQADHNTMVQKTFDEIGKTGGVDAQANFVQSLRPSYDKYMGIAQAAISQGRLDMAMRFIEQGHNLLPNGQKLNISVDGKGGGLIATVRPEDRNAGSGYSIRMTPAQLYDFATGPAAQFDLVAKNGIEANLKKLTGADRSADVPLKSSSPGGGVLAGPGGAPAQIGGVGADRTSSAMNGRAAPGRSFDPATGNIVRRDISETTGARIPRYDVERNIGESERPGFTDRGVGEGVQRIIAGTRGPAEAAARNRTPEGAILDPTAPARSLEATDPRSIAARTAFARQVTRQPAEGPRPLTADEQLAAQRTAAPAAAPAAAAPAAAPARTVQAASPTAVMEPSERLAPANDQMTATGSATENRPPATPEQAAAVLRTYRGDRPPWPAQRGQQWLRSPSTGLWRLG